MIDISLHMQDYKFLSMNPHQKVDQNCQKHVQKDNTLDNSFEYKQENLICKNEICQQIRFWYLKGVMFCINYLCVRFFLYRCFDGFDSIISIRQDAHVRCALQNPFVLRIFLIVVYKTGAIYNCYKYRGSSCQHYLLLLIIFATFTGP